MAKLILLSFCIFLLTGVGYSQSTESSPPESTFVKNSLSVTNHVELYPNPVTDVLNIRIDNSTFDKVEFELYNIIGNELKVHVEETGKNQFKISLKELNAGYYLLVVKDPVKRINKSFKFQKR